MIRTFLTLLLATAVTASATGSAFGAQTAAGATLNFADILLHAATF